MLAGVLLVAAALRFHGLAVQSLWHDELFSWYASQLGSIQEAVGFGAIEDVHPPGFIILMFGAQRLLGDSETALRLPAAIAGVVSVAWMYRLGATLLSRREGLTASALSTVAWMPIYYSQEERPYIWLFLGSVALAERMVSLIRSAEVKHRVSIGHRVQVLLISVALSYLHYFGLLLSVLGLLAWGLWAFARRAGRTAWASVTVLLVAAYVPWISALSIHVARGRTWIPMPTPASVAGMYDRMANQQGIVMAGLWLVGLVCASSTNSEDKGALPRQLRRMLGGSTGLLLSWASIPALVAIGVSIFVLPVVTDRNLIVVLPALLLITAQAVGCIERRLGRGPWVTGLLVVGLLCDLIGGRDYYRRATKWQYREAAQTIVLRAADESEAPFVVSGAWHPSYSDYYFARQHSRVRVSATAIGADPIRRICDRERPMNLWITSPAPTTPSAHDSLHLAGYDQIASWKFIGWDLHHFRATAQHSAVPKASGTSAPPP